MATLIYTSGTTGRPKGVRLAHDAWSYMAVVIGSRDGLLYPEDMQYLWLPLAHVFGKVLTAGQIYVGHATAVDGRVDKLIENLPVVRPTYMCGVPRIFEKVYNGVAARAARAARPSTRSSCGPPRSPASTPRSPRTTSGVPAPPPYRWACAPGTPSPTGWSSPSCARRSAGGCAPRCRLGRPRARDRLLLRRGRDPHPRGYGLTETSAASFLNPENYRTGTVGQAFTGTEVRVAEDGEILLRGPGVMQGYHGLPELTEQVLESDGWFHTGDIGELSADGFLRITDRKKDLIKTSGGKYIAPAEVEGQFKAVCPYVSNILVHGADRNYCTALISLDEPTIMEWARENELAATDYAEVVASEEVRELIDGYVRTLNEGLQRWQTIKKFRLLPRDLDVEHGELTRA
ncbi:AMP-binding protein [Streptomyces sp. M19]